MPNSDNVNVEKLRSNIQKRKFVLAAAPILILIVGASTAAKYAGIFPKGSLPEWSGFVIIGFFVFQMIYLAIQIRILENRADEACVIQCVVEHVACTECGTLILMETAEATSGRCMPCKNGTREQIEAGQQHNEIRKQYDPFQEHWISLVKRVHETDSGFDGLSPDEQLYFAVGLVDLDVTNGGTHQYFSNFGGAYYTLAVAGLKRLEATQTLDLLRSAKTTLFGEKPVPADSAERWDAMKQYPENPDSNLPEWCAEIDKIDNQLWDDPDGLHDLLCQFAQSTGMIEPFREPKNS